MSQRVLFLLHIPPPVHGSSMVGKWIKGSDLVNKTFSCRYINLLASDSVSQSGVISIRKIIGFIGVWWKLFINLLRHKPDLCYLALTTTGIAFYRDALLVCTIRLFGIPRIFHLHNKGVKDASTGKWKRWLYKSTFKGTDVILLSDFLYSDIENFVQRDMVHICPNGIPDSGKYAGTKNLASDVPKILFLSNLIKSKGIFVLLEALNKLKNKNIEFSCIVVGREGDVTELQFQQKLSTLGLNGSVKYQGGVYGEEKYEIMNSVDVLTLPTFFECFPLVLLEAMEHGLPVISTREGGIPDIVEDGVNGYLVAREDADELAEKLEKMILDPQLRTRMGNAGREKFEHHFKLDIFERRLVNILAEVINRHK